MKAKWFVVFSNFGFSQGWYKSCSLSSEPWGFPFCDVSTFYDSVSFVRIVDMLFFVLVKPFVICCKYTVC